MIPPRPVDRTCFYCAHYCYAIPADEPGLSVLCAHRGESFRFDRDFEGRLVRTQPGDRTCASWER